MVHPPKRNRLTDEQKQAISDQLVNNRDIQSLIIENFFNDAFLGKEKRNENANARLKFQQKEAPYGAGGYGRPKEFVHHLYNKFKPLGIVGVDERSARVHLAVRSEPPRKTSYTHKLTNNTHTSYQITTFTLPFFTELHSQWYVQRDGKDIKIVRA